MPGVPDLITMYWGEDEIFIQDPVWCSALAAEATFEQDFYRPSYREQYSREEVEMAGLGFGDLDEALSRPKGVPRPVQPPAARSCLKALFGLDLPAALLLTDFRNPTGLVATRVWLERLHSTFGSFSVALAFSGLRLYANGRIGDPIALFRIMQGCSVQQRTLDNHWRHVRFDGPAEATKDDPPTRFAPKRVFWLEDGQLIDPDGKALREVSL